MAGSAYIHVVGNVGADPEVREAGRSDICSFRIAVNTRGRDRDEVTTWYEANVWGTKGQGLLDVADQYVRKGMQISVHGDLTLRVWSDRDGKERTTPSINVRGLVLGSGGDDRDRGRDRGGDRGGDRDRGRGREDRDRGRERGRDDRSRDDRGRDDRRASSNGDARPRDEGRQGSGAGGGPAWTNPQGDRDLDDEIPF